MNWWDWWFAQDRWRRALGALLLGLLLAYTVVPLIQLRPDTAWPVAPTVGETWEHYVLPVASIVLLLILPAVRRIGSQGVEMNTGPVPDAPPVSPPLPPPPTSSALGSNL